MSDDDLPSNVTPLRSSRPASPSCPYCGQHDTTSRVSHPAGEFFCSCGNLFHGTDSEWRKLARVREEFARRRWGTQAVAAGAE